MRSSLLALIGLSAVLAAPPQLIFDSALDAAVDAIQQHWDNKATYPHVQEDLAAFDVVTSAEFPQHKLRVKSSKLCVRTARRYEATF
jgi:hypothetical protein